jgi:hypothetical protein
MKTPEQILEENHITISDNRIKAMKEYAQHFIESANKLIESDIVKFERTFESELLDDYINWTEIQKLNQ